MTVRAGQSGFAGASMYSSPPSNSSPGLTATFVSRLAQSAVTLQAAKKTGKQAAKVVAKQAAKAAAKNAALGAATTGARRVAALLPAGDEQLQFEITAIFGLAIADIHGMSLDKEQARALVYGLSNERVSQQQIATMATDLARVSSGSAVGVGHAIAAGRSDWSHWANTLADALPGGAAQSLVSTIQTGHLDTLRLNLSGKQQAAIEYGVGAVVAGVTRFLFGREVVDAARVAFADAPDEFPCERSYHRGSRCGRQSRGFPVQAQAAGAPCRW